MENVGLLQAKIDKLRDTRGKLENNMRLKEARNCQHSTFRMQTLEKELEVLRDKKDAAKTRNERLLEEIYSAITFFSEATSSLGLWRSKDNLRKAKVQFAEIVKSQYPEWVRAISDPLTFQQENYAQMLQRLKDLQEAEAEEFNRQVEAQREFQRSQEQYHRMLKQGEELHQQRERMLSEMRTQNEEVLAGKPWPEDRVNTAERLHTAERLNTAATRSRTPDVSELPRQPSLGMSSGEQVSILQPVREFLSFGNPMPVQSFKLDRPPSSPPRQPPPIEVESPSRDSAKGISLIPADFSASVQQLPLSIPPLEPLDEFDPEAERSVTTKYIDLEEDLETSGPLRPPPSHGPVQQPLHSFGSPVAAEVHELPNALVQGGSSIVRVDHRAGLLIAGKVVTEASEFDQPSKTDSSRVAVPGTFQIPEVDVEGSLEDSSQLNPYLASVTQSGPRRPPISVKTHELSEDMSNASSKFTPTRKKTSSVDFSPRSMTSSIITTDNPQLLCVHEFLNNLSHQERLTIANLLKKQAQETCLRAGKRLSNLMKVRVTEAELEQLVRNFRSSGRVAKQASAEKCVVSLLMLCSSLKDPFLPFELGKSRVDFSELVMQDKMSEEHYEIYVVIKDFVLAAINHGWIKEDLGVKLLVYNLVNYKVSKRQFTRAEESLKKILRLALNKSPLEVQPKSRGKSRKQPVNIADFQEIEDLEL